MNVIVCECCGKDHYLPFSGYQVGVDYKSAHLEFLKRTKNFIPSKDVYENPETYYEAMTEVYKLEGYTQAWAYTNLMKDKKHYRMMNEVLMKCDMELSKTDNIKGKYFVTIGFNHQTYTDKLMMKYMETLVGYEWLQSLLAKFEIHRTNGMHPHVHMIMETQLTKSKVIEKLQRCKGGRVLILKKEMIDVKMWEPRHDKYIAGQKTEEKMECVDKDAAYRLKNGIPEYWKK